MPSRYFKSREVKGNAMNMFPPGRIIFVRPLKQYDGDGKKVGQEWDTVWITPEEIISEGILISPKVGRPGSGPVAAEGLPSASQARS